MSQDDTFLDAEVARAHRLARLLGVFHEALMQNYVPHAACLPLLERYADALLTEQYYRSKEFARDTL